MFALLRKCGLFRFRPLSTGCEQTNAFRTSVFHRSRVTGQPLLKLTSFSPDRTSSNASRRVPSLRSSIKSSTRSGGLLWKRFRSSILSFLVSRHSQRNLYTTIENAYSKISKKKIKIPNCIKESSRYNYLFCRNYKFERNECQWNFLNSRHVSHRIGSHFVTNESSLQLLCVYFWIN